MTLIILRNRFKSLLLKLPLIHFIIKIKWMFLPKSRTRFSYFGKEYELYINSNKKAWFDFFNHHDQNNEYILVSQKFSYANEWILSKNIITAFLSKILKSKPLVLLNKFDNDQTIKTCESFTFKNFIALHNENFDLKYKLKAFFTSLYLFINLKNGSDLLKLHYKKILIGDLIYDSYINTIATGTISKIKLDLFPFIYEIMFYYYRFKNIYSKYNIKYLVIEVEERTCNHGIILRMALNANITSYLITANEFYNINQTNFAVTKYKSIVELYDKLKPTKPPLDLINFIEQEPNLKSSAVKVCEERINSELNIKSNNKKVHIAHHPDKRIIDKNILLQTYNLDETKPIAVIMSHVFIDTPHAHGITIFDDHLIWFRETLNYIKNITNVNWLIKPHPIQYSYLLRSQESSESEFKKIFDNTNFAHVHLLPDNIRTISFFSFADVFVTSMGSIGIESACFGIPTIVAGNSFNSGFGFTIDCNTSEEYTSALNNVPNINKLTSYQIERAKIAYALLNNLFYLKSGLMPEMNDKSDRYSTGFWTNARQLIENQKNINENYFFKNFEKYINLNDTHLVNYDLIKNYNTTIYKNDACKIQ